MLKTALLSLTGILFFVWPIPDTITIREISFILSLLITGYLIYGTSEEKASVRVFGEN